MANYNRDCYHTTQEDRIAANMAKFAGERRGQREAGVVLTEEHKAKCYAAMSPEDRDMMKLAEAGWKIRG